MLIHLMYMVNRITNYKNGLRISWLTTIIFSLLGLLIPADNKRVLQFDLELIHAENV